MKIEIGTLLKTLGLPAGLVVVVAAVLGLVGLSLDQVLLVAGSMVGLWALLSLAVNILKVAGVVNAGTSGKWSAVFNLLAIAGISYILYTDPSFDFVKLDGAIQIIAQFGVLILGYLVNVMGTKAVHRVQVDGFGVQAFTFKPVMQF